MESKTFSQTVYERIVSIYKNSKAPVSLWQVYKLCRKLDGMSMWRIRGCLRWLFDNGFLKWVDEGHLIPLKEVDNEE